MAKAISAARQNLDENKDEQKGYYVYRRYLHKLVEERGKPDLTDPKAVRRRVEEFFGVCEGCGVKPTMPGLATALGVTWQELSLNPSRQVVMAAQDIYDIEVQLIEDGRIAPNIGIFMLKNWFGLKDVNETSVKVTHVNASAEEIKEKYANVELIERGNEKRPKRRLRRGK